jgi:16S rRNA (cytosine1402-N4)-methyltransferase
MGNVHVSVLVEEICRWLIVKEGGVYVDCTLGAGGTAREILKKAGKNAVVIGLDRDSEAIALSKETLKSYELSVFLYNGNFSHIEEFVKESGFRYVDGIVFDLGVSSMQLDQPVRGFSFSQDGPLDMRMDQAQSLTAEELVNRLPEKELADLIFQYGEERYSRRIAKAILRARVKCPITTTGALVKVIEEAVPAFYKWGRVHPATRTFQALRISVNRELDILEESLKAAIRLLSIGGRICVVSFHSLEDRIVKHTFRSMAAGNNPLLRILTKKPVVPSEQEIHNNPRSRSAKLRVAQRVDPEEGRTL